MTNKKIYVVHCVDTEGPLDESLQATFVRLKEIFDIDFSASEKNLEALRLGEIPLDGLEKEVAKVISSHLLDYKRNWKQIDEMLDNVTSSSFRNALPDGHGKGWVFSWHCLDHVGFIDNPRNRDLGFHKIYDHYIDRRNQENWGRDEFQFHHHPVPFSREAHRPATHFFNHSPMVFETLTRRIIDRQWFPSVNRPGFHATRPDSHWFLEQFVPFDLANQAIDEDYSAQRDLSGGRYGDWRRAPKNWTPYHPAHDDYQSAGDCRRWIGRCLNIGTRLRLLGRDDVVQAYQQANAGEPVILAVTNHDFRDMAPDIEGVRSLLHEVGKEFPGVQFEYCGAREAFRKALGLAEEKPINFSLSLDANRLDIVADKETFGPQPFLALRTKKGKYYHDNLDFQQPFHSWSYTLDENTVQLANIDRLAIASCDKTGNVTIANFNFETRTASNFTQ
jgi:hypothetical protein